MEDFNLSPHFYASEAYTSAQAERKGLSNIPPFTLVGAIKRTALYMEEVRSILNSQVISVQSWYRSPAVNKLVGGSKDSQHMRGEAVDFVCRGFGTPVEIVKKLIASKLPYDQLILEHTWVHISFAISTGSPRREVLTLVPARRKGDKPTYAAGITDKEGKPLC